jgi:hypothetical protein
MSKESAFEVGRLYLPVKQIADTLAASQKDVFVRLPGLVGYWPMGIRAAGAVTDHSGGGFALTQTGTCPVGYDGNSFSHLGSGTNFVWNSSSQLNLTGLETWVSSSLRGLTVGGWFMIDTSPTTNSGLASKEAAVPDRGYALAWITSDQPFFSVSGNGSSIVTATAPVSTLGGWHFLVGRFTPSTEVAIFNDGDKTVNITAIPASINASAQAFEIGRYLNDNNRVIHAKARDVFICASALSDALIEEVRTTSVP